MLDMSGDFFRAFFPVRERSSMVVGLTLNDPTLYRQCTASGALRWAERVTIFAALPSRSMSFLTLLTDLQKSTI